LADGTRTNRPAPVPVAGLTGVAAVAAGGSHSLFIAARFCRADFDSDSDADLDDFVRLMACFNGPNRPANQAECQRADFDADADIDLADFLAFQDCFNGPNRPPKCE
jgi:hypothetical protein